MKTVYIILEGNDCEGAYIQGVFAKKEDAILYLKNNYKGWETKFDGLEMRYGCTSAFVEEWDIE